MRAVDTNVLVRLFTGDDVRQTALAESFVARGAWVSHVALVETIWVLESVYSRTRAQSISVIERLLSHESLVLHDPEIVLAALERFRAAPFLRFSDCMIVESARKAGHQPLGTFDRNLARKTDAELIVPDSRK